jgi:hypothetical protein
VIRNKKKRKKSMLREWSQFKVLIMSEGFPSERSSCLQVQLKEGGESQWTAHQLLRRRSRRREMRNKKEWKLREASLLTKREGGSWKWTI